MPASRAGLAQRPSACSVAYVSSRPRTPRVGPPAGTDHLYEVFRGQVDEQLVRAETLDRKLGVAIAALIAITGAIYAAGPPVAVGALLAAWLLVALVQAIRGFSYDDRFADGPDGAFLREREDLDPEIIRWHTLIVLEESLKANEPRLARNGRLLNQVTYTAGLIAATVLLSRVLGIVA